MPEVKLFIATSLDGFIADRDGGVDWLFADGDYGYAAFFDSIETLIMGRRTYEQVLGFGEWPYGEKPTYVFTRGAPGGDHPHVEFVSGEARSEEHTSELQSRQYLVCRLLLEKK